MAAWGQKHTPCDAGTVGLKSTPADTSRLLMPQPDSPLRPVQFASCMCWMGAMHAHSGIIVACTQPPYTAARVLLLYALGSLYHVSMTSKAVCMTSQLHWAASALTIRKLLWASAVSHAQGLPMVIANADVGGASVQNGCRR